MLAPLTPREKEIVLLIVNEFSSQQIAGQFELSIRTVETHRKNIYRKTNTNNIVGLIKFAIRQGLMDGYHYSNRSQSQKVVTLKNIG